MTTEFQNRCKKILQSLDVKKTLTQEGATVDWEQLDEAVVSQLMHLCLFNMFVAPVGVNTKLKLESLTFEEICVKDIWPQATNGKLRIVMRETAAAILWEKDATLMKSQIVTHYGRPYPLCKSEYDADHPTA